ncbi:30S ribosomal protein S4 [Candidatus Beckwithbacteria bacterium]|nr:30S ribosomal protein S4 [Candidatus Beckwithbacteria bacterium]
MARYTGPKNRLARSLGRELGLKTNAAKLDRRLQVPPGQHGPKGRRGKPSDYSLQLKEKQKVRWTYGVLERQFRRYFEEARKNPKATGTRLLQLLELRLDNAIFRAGLAPTRTAARQFVTHGHVLVNGKKVDIPSYQVKTGDTVTLVNKLLETPVVKTLLENKKYQIPKWMERKAAVGKIVREPERNEMDSDISEQLIVEYYSR